MADPARHLPDSLGTLLNPVGSVGDKVNVGWYRLKSTKGTLDTVLTNHETTTLKALQVSCPRLKALPGVVVACEQYYGLREGMFIVLLLGRGTSIVNVAVCVTTSQRELVRGPMHSPSSLKSPVHIGVLCRSLAGQHSCIRPYPWTGDQHTHWPFQLGLHKEACRAPVSVLCGGRCSNLHAACQCSSGPFKLQCQHSQQLPNPCQQMQDDRLA